MKTCPIFLLRLNKLCNLVYWYHSRTKFFKASQPLLLVIKGPMMESDLATVSDKSVAPLMQQAANKFGLFDKKETNDVA